MVCRLANRTQGQYHFGNSHNDSTTTESNSEYTNAQIVSQSTSKIQEKLTAIFLSLQVCYQHLPADVIVVE